jgi:hypothetical protein
VKRMQKRLCLWKAHVRSTPEIALAYQAWLSHFPNT